MVRALILAAGQGTRLRPLTDDRPKCLVPLLGKSLLARQTDTMRSCGIHRIRVVGGYRVDQIRRAGFHCYVNKAYGSTNMVESLFSAMPFIREDGDLVVSYGDIVYEEKNLRAVLNTDADIAVMVDARWRPYWELRFDDPLEDAETLVIDSEGRIVELGGKPDSYERIQAQYTGLIKFRGTRLHDLIEFHQQLDRTSVYGNQSFPNMYMTSFLQALIDSGWTALAVSVENGWLEVDTTQDLRRYEALAREGSLAEFYQPAD